jgi:glycosyltransferase involved in cell wall biosynthesis
MRIDLVITELNTGGAERCCTELAIYLKRRGHSVRIISLGVKPKPSRDALLRRVVAEGIDTVFLNGHGAWAFPIVLWRLLKTVRGDRPQVVQSFLWHANVLGAAVCRLLAIPQVGGVRVAEPRRSRAWLGRWAANSMSRIVCVSQGVADWCLRTERVNPEKVVVIPNGIASSDVTVPTSLRRGCSDQGIEPGAKMLLFVGRLEPQKGIDVLAEGMPSLLSNLPSHHLVVIGEGSMRPVLDGLAQDPSVRGRVHVLGQRDDVLDWMRAADLLLLPTRYEGMPNVVLEAMSVGLPVVTTRVEGVPELLGERLDDQAVAVCDWEGFFELAKSISMDESRRRTVGEFNRDRVQREFDLEQQLGKYELLYRQVTK